MKITELLVESQQLDEGPFTQAVGKVGGKIAKGAAAIGKDLKTGFKAGYSGEEPAADTAATQAAPAKKAGGGFIDQFKKGFAQGRSEPAAEPAADAPGVSAAKPAAAEPTATSAAPAPAAADNASPDITAMKKELDTLLKNYEDDLAMQNKNWKFVMPKVNALEKQVASLVAAGSAAPAAEPETKRRGGKVAGELSSSPSAVRRREQRARGKAAPTQAEIDADRERNIGMASDSVIRTGASLSETLARKVQEQKQRMYETALMSGTQSVFKK